jgi:hypothetical protein
VIYFVQPIDGGPVKFGTSGNVGARVGHLESHYRKPLALLATRGTAARPTRSPSAGTPRQWGIPNWSWPRPTS